MFLQVFAHSKESVSFRALHLSFHELEMIRALGRNCFANDM